MNYYKGFRSLRFSTNFEQSSTTYIYSSDRNRGRFMLQTCGGMFEKFDHMFQTWAQML